MLFVNLLLALTTLVALALSLLIIISNHKKRVNQSLAVFVLTLFLWLLANLLTNLSPTASTALIFARTTLVFAALIPYTFLIFVEFYLDHKVTWKQLARWAVLPAILILLSPTSFNIQSIEANGLNTVTGPAYFLLILELLGYIGVGLYRLYQRYRAPRVTSLQKAQLRYIFLGFVGAFVPIFVLNVIVPIVSSESDVAILFGPNAVIFLALFTTIAIIRHRLLDIRFIVARSVGYILSIAFLAALFGLVTFTIINRFLFTADTITVAQQLTYTLLAVLIAFTFPPIKRFFDKQTNRIFYRDAYDPQQLLDSLNKTLVSTIELRSLLHWVSQIISSTLKAEFCLLDIQQADHKEKVIGTPDTLKISAADLEVIQKVVPTLHRKVLLTDDLESESPRLQKVLRDNNIALIAHLVDSPKQEAPGLGYLILGGKKSGNPYSTEDARLMEIITDELVIAVQNALRFDEIQNFNVTLQAKVDEATRKLRRTNEKLKQLDQTKDDFISMASHQLRTPLTSVKGYVSMVLEGDAGKITKQQEKLLEQAFTSSQRMVYLIADLLNVSRLRTGKFIIEAKPTNLGDVVDGEISQLTETAKGRDLTLEYHKPKEFPTLNLDETKIRQVIMNFVDNAIYYTPAGGHITVSLADKPESIELTVVDDGLGVPKHEQQHLFTKFYRAQNAKKARPDGTGLGLFMAKKVIIAQGGAIIFRSTEGKGSTFGFSFPKRKLLVK